MSFRALSILDQLGEADKRINDPRGRIATGYSPLDSLLHRGGLAPGELVVIGGRTGTRKTTLMMNLIARLLQQGRAIGLLGLDESGPNYVLKLMSAMRGISHERLEEIWNTPEGKGVQASFTEDAAKFVLSQGYRPDFDSLDVWLDEASIEAGQPLEVVFIDYTSLLARGKYDGGENQRVMRLVENLQVWTNTHQIVTIALHQVGRFDDGSARRNEGDRPLTSGSLKYGGEEIADLVIGTYRPALDPIGNMTCEEALALYDKLDEETWEKHRNRVDRYEKSTLVQVLKNRPGTRVDKVGLEFISVGDTQRMRTVLEREDRIDEEDHPGDDVDIPVDNRRA